MMKANRKNHKSEYDDTMSWNAMHSSPADIGERKEFLRTLSIEKLKEYRDQCIDQMKRYESSPNKGEWYLAQQHYFDYPLFDYVDWLDKISCICSLIQDKWLNMYWYCEQLPEGREKQIDSMTALLIFIEDNPEATYSHIVEQNEKEWAMLLDYLIETGTVRANGNAKQWKWEICRFHSPIVYEAINKIKYVIESRYLIIDDKNPLRNMIEGKLECTIEEGLLKLLQMINENEGHVAEIQSPFHTLTTDERKYVEMIAAKYGVF